MSPALPRKHAHTELIWENVHSMKRVVDAYCWLLVPSVSKYTVEKNPNPTILGLGYNVPDIDQDLDGASRA